jgi:hypothetical protein
LAVAGNDLYEGLRWRNTDGLDLLYEYRSAAWLQRGDFFAVADAAARTAITNPHEGMAVYQKDTDIIYIHNGTDWVIWETFGAWITYTPSNTAITVGNGTQVAKYSRSGRTIRLSWYLLWGSTTSFSGSARVGLPFGAATDRWQQLEGHGQDTGTAGYSLHGNIGIIDFTSALLMHTGGTFTNGNVDGTHPHTWANTDVVALTGVYEAAASA